MGRVRQAQACPATCGAHEAPVRASSAPRRLWRRWGQHMQSTQTCGYAMQARREFRGVMYPGEGRGPTNIPYSIEFAGACAGSRASNAASCLPSGSHLCARDSGPFEDGRLCSLWSTFRHWLPVWVLSGCIASGHGVAVVRAGSGSLARPCSFPLVMRRSTWLSAGELAALRVVQHFSSLRQQSPDLQLAIAP